MKLFIPRARLHVWKYFFSHRVVPHWNSLPQHVVSEQLQVAIGQILACYGRQKPTSFLVHQLSSSSSSSAPPSRIMNL